MKYIYGWLMSLLILASCGQKTKNEQVSKEEVAPEFVAIGENFDHSQAVEVAAMQENFFSGQATEFVVKGKVEEVCQKKGCWMKIQAPDGKNIHVKFKDYGLFMPFDIAGKQVVMHGLASYDTLSVEYLRHLAEDANKPAEEIAKITEPKVWMAFEADGVAILDYKISEQSKEE